MLTPARLECTGRRTGAWCRKAELNGRADSETQGSHSNLAVNPFRINTYKNARGARLCAISTERPKRKTKGPEALASGPSQFRVVSRTTASSTGGNPAQT